jgi:asparaginyl-tRNA synthetase
MSRVYIEDISAHDGQKVTICGWVYNKRSSGKIRFLILRDGTGIIQGVMAKNDVDEDTFSLHEKLTQESSVKVTGNIRADRRAPGGYELSITDIQLVHLAEPYPITPKEHGTGFLMDHRHLWLRSSKQHAVLRVRSTVIKAIRDFFDDRGFILLDAPIFTPSACEGTSTLFETDYFEGKKAYLSQSGQLYAEAGAMAFGKVYTFGPTFRAEKSKTRRHLTEFWMVEPEVAFAELNEIMDLAEEMVEYIVGRVLEARVQELEILERDTSRLEMIKKPFPRISYSQALDLLVEKGSRVEWGEDFGGDEETVLSKLFDRPVMVHRYPKQCKAFYMKADPEDTRLALCVDMLAPEGYGEIIGGSQREDDLDTLHQRIVENGLSEKDFGWYLDLRRYGSVPHAGYGLGIERTVAWICGIAHVREAIPFPRMLYRLYP